MLTRSVLAVCAMSLLTASLALAEERASSTATPSLGDLARQERAQRMKVMQERSVRIWTNDNMPRRGASGGGVSVAGEMSSEPPAPATSSVEPAAGSEEGSASGGHDEAYYRKRTSEIQARKELHERQLSILQQKLGQNQMQYYPDPNKALQQEYSRSDINRETDEIKKKQQEIADDDKAMDDLRDQLRREGHPAGWLR